MPDTENEVQGNDVQQELMDMIIADESPATISCLLYTSPSPRDRG